MNLHSLSGSIITEELAWACTGVGTAMEGELLHVFSIGGGGVGDSFIPNAGNQNILSLNLRFALTPHPSLHPSPPISPLDHSQRTCGMAIRCIQLECSYLSELPPTLKRPRPSLISLAPPPSPLPPRTLSPKRKCR